MHRASPLHDAIRLAAAIMARGGSGVSSARQAERQRLAAEYEAATDREIQKLARRGHTRAEIQELVAVSYGRVRSVLGHFIKLGSKRGPYNIQERHAAAWPFVRSSEMSPLEAVVNAAVPAGLDPERRRDVCQDLCVAVLSGEVALGDVAKVARKYSRRRIREAEDKRFLSIDYPFPGKTTPIKELLPDTGIEESV